MSAEIAANLNVSINVSGNSVIGSSIFNADVVSGFEGTEQTIATTSTALDLGGLAGGIPKALFIKNLDPTNFVQIDSASTFDKFPQKLLPGQGIFLLPETATIYAKADTASVQIFITAGA